MTKGEEILRAVAAGLARTDDEDVREVIFDLAVQAGGALIVLVDLLLEEAEGFDEPDTLL